MDLVKNNSRGYSDKFNCLWAIYFFFDVRETPVELYCKGTSSSGEPTEVILARARYENGYGIMTFDNEHLTEAGIMIKDATHSSEQSGAEKYATHVKEGAYFNIDKMLEDNFFLKRTNADNCTRVRCMTFEVQK